jgi:hypothetical protein
LKLVHVCVHDACREHQDGIIRLGGERLSLFRHGKRFSILRAQTKQEPQPVQQTSGHRMLRNVGQQPIGTLESALRFQVDTKQLRGRHAAQRGERDLECVALCFLDTRSSRVKARSVRVMHRSDLKSSSARSAACA